MLLILHRWYTLGSATVILILILVLFLIITVVLVGHRLIALLLLYDQGHVDLDVVTAIARRLLLIYIAKMSHRSPERRRLLALIHLIVAIAALRESIDHDYVIAFVGGASFGLHPASRIDVDI